MPILTRLIFACYLFALSLVPPPRENSAIFHSFFSFCAYVVRVLCSWNKWDEQQRERNGLLWFRDDGLSSTLNETNTQSYINFIWPATNMWLFRSPFVFFSLLFLVWWRMYKNVFATIFGCVCAHSLDLGVHVCVCFHKSFWNWNVFCAPIFIPPQIIFSFQSNGWHFYLACVQPACLSYGNTNIVCCCCRCMLRACGYGVTFFSNRIKSSSNRLSECKGIKISIQTAMSVINKLISIQITLSWWFIFVVCALCSALK